MKKMKEAYLTQACVIFAGKYVDEKFKNGSMVEKNLVLNSLAHGFFMGRRHAEKTYNSVWFNMLLIATDDKWVEKHALKAANYYLKNKGYTKLEWSEQALIRATLSTGFREGFRLGE